MIDQEFRIAPPPVDIVLSPLDNTAAHWLIGICSVLILAGLVYALREWGRTKSPIPLLLILGGAFSNLAEPFVDVGGACWHPIHGQITLFTLMDRPMPFWLLFAYIAYFGALMMCLYCAFSRGISTRAMWLWFGVPVLADIVLEESLLSLSDHLYVYYGNQPLRLHTFPIWWAAPNTIGIYLSAVLMTMFAPLLRGWRLALVPFSTVLCYAAADGVVGYPATIVINSDFPYLINQLGGVATFAIAILVVHGCTLLIASDSPYRLRNGLGMS